LTIDHQHFADRIALRALVENYARGADRRDGDLVAAQFVPDGRILIFDQGERSPAPTRQLIGRGEIGPAMLKLKRYEITTHFLGQQTVEIDGDAATGETYCMAHHVSGEGTERNNFIMSIRYLDQYQRVDDRWYFVERRLMCDWTERRPMPAS
jgi:hypothetical protein